MSFSKIISAQTHFFQSYLIDVEVDISRGLNSFSIVGLPDKAVAEAKDRVSAAIKNSGFESPKSKNQRTTISLAPAHLKKEGPHFDLAIALAYLLAVDDIRFNPKDKLFLGELSLDGSLRAIKGILPLIIKAKYLGIKEIYLPFDNKEEVLIIDEIEVFPVKHLREVVDHLNKKEEQKKLIEPLIKKSFFIPPRAIETNFEEIKGQESAKRALEIAGAGGHNIMLYGPPGTGKTMLARAFHHLLPELTFDEVLEVTTIYSSLDSSGLVFYPPFRSPHHSSSLVALVGGGAIPRPGEITLAHRGVLFMDEFPEFNRQVIESLRQPLEDRCIAVSRARNSTVFPSDFILIASMNPCACGFLGSLQKECVCNPIAIQNYQRKISGPIIDRIDMWVEVSEVAYEKMSINNKEEKSEHIQKRIQKGRLVQEKRFSKDTIKLNSRMTSKDISKHCFLSGECKKILNTYAEKLHISPRVYLRIIKLARTIADLENKKDIEVPHLLEAFQYRPKIGNLKN